MTSIRELAQRGAESPDQLSSLEIARLAFWVLDHREHVAEHQQMQAAPQQNLSELLKRLEPSKPRDFDPKKFA